MIFLFCVPFVLGLLAAWSAAPLERRLRPPTAALLLTVAACSISCCAMVALGVVGYIGLGDRLPVGPVDWSAADLRELLGVSTVVGLIATVALFVAVGAVAVRGGRMIVDHRAMGRLLDSLPESAGLTVVDDDAVIAYAVPSRRGGRTVVSTGMLRTLSAPQRRALIAHESAHLRLNHHRYSIAARLAAAGLPVLVPLTRGVDRAIERWADVEAVEAVRDPKVVADAVGAAALAMSRGPRMVLGAGHSDVVERVRWLLGSHVQAGVASQRWMRMALGAAVALTWASVIVAWGHVAVIVEVIEAGR